jgi:hypothetical protein
MDVTSLNDLHASAVGSGQAKENQGPSQFLRSKKVKDFVQTLARMQMHSGRKSTS